MYRITVLYGTPSDPEAFDDYYRNTHIPIARKMRGLTGWDLTWSPSHDGQLTPPVHLVANLYATDRDAMTTILESPEGVAASKDVENFATGGVTFLSGEVEHVPFE